MPDEEEYRHGGKDRHAARGKEALMCLTCGCGLPNEDHGDPAHITYNDLKKAADAAEISVEEAATNIQETLEKV